MNHPMTSPNPVSPVRKWGMLVVLSLALAVIILDTTILNVALASIIRDLHTDIQSIQWVITAYSLTLAALTITGGRMGDIFGKKRMFMLGAVLFAIGSFIASISTSVPMLVAGESIIEGVGAALMMPATASLLVENFFGRERAIAFGVWGGIAGASAALGPILGGYLATNYSWRWGFRVNLIVVSLLIIGSLLIPAAKYIEKKPKLDLFGVLLSAFGLLSLVFGLIESSTYGWWKASELFVAFSHTITMPWGLSVVPFFILIGVVILAIFMGWECYYEKIGKTPLVSLNLFTNRTFSSGIATTAVMSLGQTGLIFALPVFLQSVRGLDAYHTGLSLLPMSLALLVVAPLSAFMSKKVSPKFLISLGLFINTIAYVVLYYTMKVSSTGIDLAPGLAIFGIGMGMVMSQVNNITLSAVEPRQAGEASGVSATLRQVGSTLGSAIMGAILIGSLGSQLSSGVQSSSVIPENLKPTLADAMKTQSSNVEFGGGAVVKGSIPDNVKAEIVRIGHESTVEATKQTLAFGGLFALLGFLSAAILLPGKKKMAKDDAISEAHVSHHVPKPADHPVLPLREFDMDMIGELIAVDKARTALGKPGIGNDVRAVIDAAQMDSTITEGMDPRFTQGRALFDKGFGKELGHQTFAAYFASLPPVPANLRAHSAAFPHLVLVDARLSPIIACRLLNIAPKGEPTAADVATLSEKREAYWIRVSNTNTHLGQTVNDALAKFSSNEKPLTVSEGIALVAQMPELVQTHFIDLAGTAHAGLDNTAACIGTWNNQTEIRWRWKDHEDPKCGAISKMNS